MKNILICSVLLFVLPMACQQAETQTQTTTSTFDEGKETAAIMQVIEGETKCFFDGNYDCWAKHWVHQPYAMQAWNNDDGTFDAAIGWEKINTQGKEWIEKYYKNGKNVVHPVVKREKPQVKFYNENVAYLLWKQYNANSTKTHYIISQETRLMEKHDGAWQIANVSAFWNAKSRVSVDSLNAILP
jgi:hypothetical protein